MDMDFLATYIQPDSLALIPVLYLIGLFLRQSPQSAIPIWTHPWITLVVGVASCMGYYGPSITAFVQGVLVAGAAVLMKDLIHLTANGAKTKDDENKTNGF